MSITSFESPSIWSHLKFSRRAISSPCFKACSSASLFVVSESVSLCVSEDSANASLAWVVLGCTVEVQFCEPIDMTLGGRYFPSMEP